MNDERKSRDPEDEEEGEVDELPRRWPWAVALAGILVTAVGLVVAAFLVALSLSAPDGRTNQPEADRLREADRLWQDGLRDQAVALYKEVFGALSKEEKTVALKRIAEHLNAKDTPESSSEAHDWVIRGFDEGLDPAYDDLMLKATVDFLRQGDAILRQATKIRGK